jgi:hypothetical protein
VAPRADPAHPGSGGAPIRCQVYGARRWINGRETHQASVTRPILSAKDGLHVRSGEREWWPGMTGDAFVWEKGGG